MTLVESVNAVVLKCEMSAELFAVDAGFKASEMPDELPAFVEVL